MLTKRGYRPRIIDAQVEENMRAFGAIMLEGPKWCGKTWTMLNHAESVFYVGDPASNFNNRHLAQQDPALILEGKEPRAIDEWQEVPGIWDAVRHEADNSNKTGRFLLTGSSVPPREATIHSGIGRIVRMRMRPMTLQESRDSTGDISLRALLEGKSPRCTTGIDLKKLVRLVGRGGWPAGLGLPDKSALQIPQSYFQTLAETDAVELDGVRRDTSKMGRVLRSLARNNQTQVTYRTINRDIAEFDGEEFTVSEITIATYIRILERLFVIEKLDAWSHGFRSSSRIRVGAKLRFVDPSLALAALRMTPDALMSDLNTLGFMFESLCARDLSVYTEALGHNLYHYRDKNGLEADFIIEMMDGNWAPVEVKLGANGVDEAVKSLMKVREKMMAGGAKEPVCMIVLCGLSNFGYTTPEGVCVVPITCLGV
ncbi:MAG: ATP-binding protein [Coriobacteriia bacterium]|nr:ATP-binding protein [Coriobacteriia bacterium]